jgi:hypothetical protein
MKTKAVSTVVSQEVLAQLQESYPVEQGTNRISLPRISYVSQDKTEGKGKAMKVVTEAGTFFTEEQTDELDENGKKLWEKSEIGTELDAIIFYQRKQLKMYDEATEKYTSSGVYDSDTETVKLWCDKKEVASGTPEELKKKYKYTDKAGKEKSALEENRLLYVLMNEKVYQLTLRGSSMYSFLSYRKNVLPVGVVTHISSEPKEKGDIQWNQMTFTVVRPINADEATDILEKVSALKFAIGAEKSSKDDTVEAVKAHRLDAYGNEIME